jgi:hypothetical protein
MFECQEMVRRMSYWHKYKHVPGEISDIFDGEHYQSLCQQYVLIDGDKLKHKFFSDPRDIALGVSTDGFQVRLFNSYYCLHLKPQ